MSESKYDDCMKLAQYFSDRFDKRRDYEWKITLGFWAAILASAYKDVHVDGWVWVAAWLAFVFTWVRGIWVANKNDKRMAKHYWEIASAILKGTDRNIQLASDHPAKIELTRDCWILWSFGFLRSWNPVFQTLATGGIMCVSYFITSKTSPTLGGVLAVIDGINSLSGGQWCFLFGVLLLVIVLVWVVCYVIRGGQDIAGKAEKDALNELRGEVRTIKSTIAEEIARVVESRVEVEIPVKATIKSDSEQGRSGASQ